MRDGWIRALRRYVSVVHLIVEGYVTDKLGFAMSRNAQDRSLGVHLIVEGYVTDKLGFAMSRNAQDRSLGSITLVPERRGASGPDIHTGGIRLSGRDQPYPGGTARGVTLHGNAKAVSWALGEQFRL